MLPLCPVKTNEASHQAAGSQPQGFNQAYQGNFSELCLGSANHTIHDPGLMACQRSANNKSNSLNDHGINLNQKK
jgi:hypothetical protein